MTKQAFSTDFFINKFLCVKIVVNTNKKRIGGGKWIEN